NAVMLPYVLSYIRPSCTLRLSNILGVLDGQMLQPVGDSNENAVECVRRLALLMKEIGIPQTLQGFDIPEASLRMLASEGTKQKRLLSRCRVQLDEGAIYEIYVKAFNGRL